VKDGPSEAAVADATEKHAPVIFCAEGSVLEARRDAVEDLSIEAGLTIRGSILSGPFEGHTFIGFCDGKGRRGCLKLESVP